MFRKKEISNITGVNIVKIGQKVNYFCPVVRNALLLEYKQSGMPAAECHSFLPSVWKAGRIKSLPKLKMQILAPICFFWVFPPSVTILPWFLFCFPLFIFQMSVSLKSRPSHYSFASMLCHGEHTTLTIMYILTILKCVSLLLTSSKHQIWLLS